MLGVVVVLEELGGDKDLGSGDTRSLDALSDLILVSVSPCTAGAMSVALRRIVGLGDILDVPVTILRHVS